MWYKNSLFPILWTSATSSLNIPSRCVKVGFVEGRRWPTCFDEGSVSLPRHYGDGLQRSRQGFEFEHGTATLAMTKTGELVEDAEFVAILIIVVLLICLGIFTCCTISGVTQSVVNNLILGDVLQPALNEWHRALRPGFADRKGSADESGSDRTGRQRRQLPDIARTPGPDVGKMMQGKWMVIYDLGTDSAKFTSFDSPAQAIAVFRSVDKFHPTANRVLYDQNLVEQESFGNAFVLDRLRCKSRDPISAPMIGNWAVSVQRKDNKSVLYYAFGSREFAEKFRNSFAIFTAELLEPAEGRHRPAGRSKRRWWEERREPDEQRECVLS